MSELIEIDEKVTTSYKPYPKYKDSGVEWLGEVPGGWTVLRLKNATYINDDSLAESTDGNYMFKYVDISSVDSQGNISDCEEIFFRDAPSRARRIGKPGNVAISTVRTYLKSIAQIPLENNLIFSTGFALLGAHLSLLEPDFLFRMVQSETFIQKVVAYSDGVSYPAIAPSKLVCLKILIPPKNEQRNIVEFLNSRASRIDALIQKKERFIELLQEKRTALITHAVTKGLDPNVPMKDSGVEWLGKIPESWEIKRLRFLSRLNPSPREIPTEKKESNVSFIPMEAIGVQGGMDVSQTRKVSDLKSGYTYFSDGDVLVAKITPCFENNKGAIAIGLSEKIGFGTTELFVLRNYESLDPKFLFYLTKSQSFRKVGKSYMYGAGGQKRIPENFVRNFTIGVPTLNVQKKIVINIELEISKIDFLVKHTLHSIELLKEYRSALITAAVTGKIDLREEVLL